MKQRTMIMFLFLLILFIFPFLVMMFLERLKGEDVIRSVIQHQREERCLLETSESQGYQTYVMKLVPEAMAVTSIKVWFPQHNCNKDGPEEGEPEEREEAEEQEEPEEPLDIFNPRDRKDRQEVLTINLYAHRDDEYVDLLEQPIVIFNNTKTKRIHQFKSYLRSDVMLEADDVLVLQREYHGTEPFHNFIQVCS